APAQQVTIDIDQQKAAQNGVAQDALSDAIKNSGLAVPVGNVAHDGHTLDVTVGEKLDSLESLKTLPLKAQDASGKDTTVKLGDIASVELTPQSSNMSARVDGQEAVALIVMPTGSANVVETSQKLHDVLDEVEPMMGEGAKFSVIFDQAPYITLSIDSLTREGVIGVVMAIAVILLFLFSVRSTLVTAISIPLSLLLAFIGMYVSGYSLNVLTMSALTITIGRVVDDSIVVIENIKRHLEYGEPKRVGIMNAVKEVASAVTASTIVTLLVYVPVAFVSGMVGQLFKPFALTVVLAMLASLLVSLTIVPVLAYWFVKPSKNVREVLAEGVTEEKIHALRQQAEKKEEKSWLRALYAPTLRVTQKHPVITLALSVVILGVTIGLYPLLNVNLMGGSGQNFVSLSQTPPAGTDMETQVEHASVAEKALMDVAGVKSVATTIGSGMSMGGGAQSTISYYITTDEKADQESLSAKLEEVLKKNSSDDEVSSSGTSALLSSAIDINITASSDELLAQANKLVYEKMQKVEGAKKVTTNMQEDQPSVQIRVNRDAAGKLGLTENAVVGMISSQMVEASIGTITLDNVDTDIYIKLADPITTFDELKSMNVMGIPLAQIATVEEVSVVPSVASQNGQRTATVSIEPADADDLGSLNDVVEKELDSLDIPHGAVVSLGGASEDLSDTFNQLGLAMIAAILLIYITLVWIFKSLAQPLLLLVAIPFAAIGAFLALMITGEPLGIAALVGLLMLVGIVVTNAIVLIDLINQYRRDGMAMDEAITLGALRRVRPIVMTAIATIAAMLPMALGISGQEGFISQPMALTVIGGLFSSTLLTLVLLPVLYRLTQKKWVAPEVERMQELTHVSVSGDSIIAGSEDN
ncbi:MAG: efflux RND transporter permease subunit, partial [Actinomycetaceae bacterium]|nr:efflux RND transporter permease subunit [Actinomycetaceae bacterium]